MVVHSPPSMSSVMNSMMSPFGLRQERSSKGSDCDDETREAYEPQGRSSSKVDDSFQRAALR